MDLDLRLQRTELINKETSRLNLFFTNVATPSTPNIMLS